MKKPMEHLRRLEVEIHRAPAGKGMVGKITGHTVHHYMEPSTQKSKSGAFFEQTHHSFPFGKDQNAEMLDHVAEHLGSEGAGAAEMEGEEA